MEGIGNRLRESRLAANLSIEDVADELKIRTCYIRAMEDNRFDELPPDIYRTGFLRTYSDFLELDSIEMLKEYRKNIHPDVSGSEYEKNVAMKTTSFYKIFFFVIFFVSLIIYVFLR